MRVVAVGGGHGTAVSLRALRLLSEEVTGVVSVGDDGGSTGRLRAMLNVAAVGDLRICLTALADPENPLTASFEHRFKVGELNGHAVGNLLLVGLIDATGDLEESVRAVAQIMGVTGTIVPASCEGVELIASTEEGPTRGQTEVAQATSIRRISVEPANSPAPTVNFRASDHVAAIHRHTKAPVLDVCVVNTHAVRGKVLHRYQANAARPVENDLDNLERMGLKVIAADLLRMSGNRLPEKIRHDSGVIGAIALELAQKGHKRKLKKK